MNVIMFVFIGFLASSVAWPLSAASQTLIHQADPALGGLGQIDFPSSGSEEAQPWFLQGLLLLHNFQYDDAKKAFQKAQALDPEFTMAYWGEAMTENHPLWMEQNREEARAILHRLAPTPGGRIAKAQTEREQGYLHAVEALYAKGNKRSRDLAYAHAMDQLTDNFPDDLDAAAFHALALLGTAQGERDYAIYMQAAAIAEEVFQKNPQHPGAVHYLIHSYDDPIHAPLGLRAARVYADLAPKASHAQHMPSHIFMALGMWDDVVRANETAWAASEARIQQKGLKIDDRPYHTLYWLMYAYLQQGRFQDAKNLLDMINDDAQKTQSHYTRNYLASMRATYTIETQQWDINHLNDDRTGLQVSAAASDLFAIGMSAIILKHPVIVKTVITQMKNRLDATKERSSKSTRTSLEIMVVQLEGLQLLHEGKPQKALSRLQEAATLEDQLPYDYGPPLPIKPAHELVGEVLLQLGMQEQAKREGEMALARAPNRTLAQQLLSIP